MRETQKLKGIALMLLCGSLWSIAGIFIKLIPWNALAISGCRSLLAAGCMAVYMRSQGMRFAVNRNSLLGGAALALCFLGFVGANKLTTAANAIVLQFTSPVFVLLISVFALHQRFSRSDLLAVLFTLGGISLFFFDQLTPGGLLGNVMALAAGLMLAIVFVVTGNAEMDARMSGILLGHLFTAAVGVPFLALGKNPFTPSAVLCILALGIVQLGIPYVLFGLSLRTCPPLLCSLLGAVEPLLNPLWVFLFDGERPGMFALAGGAVVIVTVTLHVTAPLLRPRSRA